MPEPVDEPVPGVPEHCLCQPQQNLGLTNSILIVFFMAASLFGMVLNHQMSTSILNSIKRLTDAAREIMNNNLEAADIEETPYAELNQVSATFDQMKRQIRTMITELHETHQMKERLAEAKIRELQMQMNPHFLFNTLSLVIRSIQLGERDTSIQLSRPSPKYCGAALKSTRYPFRWMLRLSCFSHICIYRSCI
mgnify:CR=1 FL=1